MKNGYNEYFYIKNSYPESKKKEHYWHELQLF